jgi:hypothetical protein
VGAYLGSSTAAEPYKPATLRLPGGDGSPFFVLDAASGAQVFAGTARVFGDGVVHEYFKQVAYHLDFSALTTPVSAAACRGERVQGRGAMQGTGVLQHAAAGKLVPQLPGLLSWWLGASEPQSCELLPHVHGP